MISAAESSVLASIFVEARGMDAAVAMLDGLGLSWPEWYALYFDLAASRLRIGRAATGNYA